MSLEFAVHTRKRTIELDVNDDVDSSTPTQHTKKKKRLFASKNIGDEDDEHGRDVRGSENLAGPGRNKVPRTGPTSSELEPDSGLNVEPERPCSRIVYESVDEEGTHWLHSSILTSSEKAAMLEGDERGKDVRGSENLAGPGRNKDPRMGPESGLNTEPERPSSPVVFEFVDEEGNCCHSYRLPRSPEKAILLISSGWAYREEETGRVVISFESKPPPRPLHMRPQAREKDTEAMYVDEPWEGPNMRALISFLKRLGSLPSGDGERALSLLCISQERIDKWERALDRVIESDLSKRGLA